MIVTSLFQEPDCSGVQSEGWLVLPHGSQLNTAVLVFKSSMYQYVSSSGQFSHAAFACLFSKSEATGGLLERMYTKLR